MLCVFPQRMRRMEREWYLYLVALVPQHVVWCMHSGMAGCQRKQRLERIRWGGVDLGGWGGHVGRGPADHS